MASSFNTYTLFILWGWEVNGNNFALTTRCFSQAKAYLTLLYIVLAKVFLGTPSPRSGVICSPSLRPEIGKQTLMNRKIIFLIFVQLKWSKCLVDSRGLHFLNKKIRQKKNSGPCAMQQQHNNTTQQQQQQLIYCGTPQSCFKPSHVTILCSGLV